MVLKLEYPFALSPSEPADINSPEVAKTPGGSSGPGKEDSMLNGHKEGEANPFAEYMWMENEEEYNRQVSITFLMQGVSYGYGWISLKISLKGLKRKLVETCCRLSFSLHYMHVKAMFCILSQIQPGGGGALGTGVSRALFPGNARRGRSRLVYSCTGPPFWSWTHPAAVQWAVGQ